MEIGMKLFRNIFKTTGATNLIMKFAVVFLVVTAMSAPANGKTTYTIKAKRITQDLIDSSIADLPDKVEPKQEITYYVDFDGQYTLELDARLENTDTGTEVYKTGEYRLDACDVPDDFWANTIIMIVSEAMVPESDCTIYKGDYILTEDVYPVKAESDDKLTCGNYNLNVDLYREKTKFLTVGFNFAIEDDCNSSK